MRYTYQTSFKNYKQAMRTYIRSRASRRLWFYFNFGGIAAMGALMILAGYFLSSPGQLLHDISIPLGIWFLIVGLVVVAMRPWQLRRNYKLWNGEIGPNSSLFLEFDGQTMITGLVDQREVRYQRGGVCNVIEDEFFVLLFLSKKKFVYFSKDALPPSAFEELRTWLALSGAPPPC